MHALLLTPGVDGDDPRVNDYYHAHDEVMLLQDHVGYQRDQIQGVLLRTTELGHHHQEVGPSKHGTANAKTVGIRPPI